MTTTIGFIVGNVVVLATDTRATAGFFVAHRTAKKIHKISDYIAMTIAGRVADAQALVDLMRANVRHFEVTQGRRMQVRALATLLSTYMFYYRFFPYQTQLLVGGVDDSGPHLFNVDPLGGVTEEKVISTGSGSPVALGVLEAEYREDLSIDEAVELAYKAVAVAIRRDIGSGDSIDVAYISPATGYVELSPAEKKALFNKYVYPHIIQY
ncbi:MAG: archaeal proteasome endopeptidase complex subunit beta [Candidatus Calditenuis sp.]|jgi:proteasome beta subunit|nr:archaeal proteasome endopeptidase complex subunit beta [Candidatus Calditenuis sp.]MDT7967784.1 archaeal proteasome endopeptidase complex subunit beta [Candidatus Calditenuis sp.]